MKSISEQEAVQIIHETGADIALMLQRLRLKLTNGSSYLGAFQQENNGTVYVQVDNQGKNLLINNLMLPNGQRVCVDIRLEGKK